MKRMKKVGIIHGGKEWDDNEGKKTREGDEKEECGRIEDVEAGGGGEREEGREREGVLTAPHFGNVFLIKVWPPCVTWSPLLLSLTQTIFSSLSIFHVR